jgi:hypothetical protein
MACSLTLTSLEIEKKVICVLVWSNIHNASRHDGRSKIHIVCSPGLGPLPPPSQKEFKHVYKPASGLVIGYCFSPTLSNRGAAKYDWIDQRKLFRNRRPVQKVMRI